MLENLNTFPGWASAPEFLEGFIERHAISKVADLGGGANPMLPEDWVRQREMDYTVLDISADELAKAPEDYQKICIDISAPSSSFKAAVKDEDYDFLFSHMFLEHVDSIERTHRNIFSMLRRGGIALHMYPSPNNIPLLINKLLPEGVTSKLLRIAQPNRDTAGQQVKFPVYYKMCGKTMKRVQSFYTGIGFQVISHTSFVGHTYYERFGFLRDVEKLLRKPLIALSLPICSAEMLILKKP